MTEEELRPLLAAYGLLPESTSLRARPHLTKAERRVLARVKRAHRDELNGAKEMRTYVLNLTRGQARPRIAAELVTEGHTEAAFLLLFNDEQLALLMAWRDARVTSPDSSSSGSGQVDASSDRGEVTTDGAPRRARSRKVSTGAGPAASGR